ncbi:hypothetical protein [Hymenobacter sediminicola]|uniref:AAA family ATPase n=1 Tax=Hymenobacter sediminicola TaxID=2761579 RepID=A0A7G7W770_9BACT|nr:hypothetical protein [Hymenobacter sediminicola]QNH62213.1 hypothetical protein H4317_19090 [Hymenobacter sediminicola]
MKKVIALYGPSSVGKSTTLKVFADMVMSHFGTSATIEYLPDDNPKADIQRIITLNGVLKVGIESQGDPGGRLSNSLGLFVAADCDLIFCATRTRGSTCHAVDALMAHNYHIDWVHQLANRTSTQQQTNSKKAADLLQRLIAIEQSLPQVV